MTPELIRLIIDATLDTLTMVAVAGGLGALFGLPLASSSQQASAASSSPRRFSTRGSASS